MQTVDKSTMDDAITTIDFATLFSQEELTAKRAEEKDRRKKTDSQNLYGTWKDRSGSKESQKSNCTDQMEKGKRCIRLSDSDEDI